MRAKSVVARAGIALASAVALSVVFLSGLAETDGAGAHLASGLLHLEGLASGLVHGLQHPLGSGFSRVGLAAAKYAGEITPGMESFVGSTVAALGWSGIGVIGLSAILFVAGDAFSRVLGVVVLAGVLISDNVASLYLYAPLLLRPFAIPVGAELRSPSEENPSVRRDDQTSYPRADDHKGLGNAGI